jgi:multiple sugar transport system substrate-binding protein
MDDRTRHTLARCLTGAAVALVALVLSCAPARRVEEIVFWQFWPGEVLTPLLQQFEREHPGLRVRVQTLDWANGLDSITAAVAGGDPPDLCELGSTWVPRLMTAGSLADWSRDVRDLEPRLRGWELCSMGGRHYGLPWVMGTRVLFYNKTLFARAGLDSNQAPETWDELYDAADRIQRLGGGIHGYGVQTGEHEVLFKKFMPFAYGNGGRVLSDDLTRPDFDTARNRQALAFYLRLREVGILGRQDSLDREFREGRLGLQVSGAWLFRSIPRDAPALRYGVALIPRPEAEHGTHASIVGGEVLVSFTGSKQKAGALALARFLVRPENALALAQSAMSVPATLGADTSEYYRERPEQQVMIRQLETAVPTPNHPAWVEMEAVIEDEVDQALHDRKTARQAVADAHRRLTGLAEKR